ncbi:hypothetical protein BOX15_Mlig028510g2 [Macrostomum lignano]|uniref:IQ calmodulin-binding motif-containing protein 1 n=1 Tax=Macrostomum lignano TaxID=282301 RepID=A0A267GZG6_9PLAT|nr:hypothetical protein BOX15_Mlig028510g2 [Macrostomum lignano]
MASAMTSKVSEIEKLAMDIGNTKDERRIPKLLLRMENILNNATAGTAAAAAVKQDIWSFDLLPLLLMAMRRDFSNVVGTWETGVKLAELAYRLMVNIYVTKAEDPEETFEKKLVPQFCENMLVLAKRLQNCYCEAVEKKLYSEMSSDKLLQCYDRVISFLVNYLRQKRTMISHTIHSPWFLQIFVTDDPETPVSTLKLLRSCISYQADLCRTMDKALFDSLMEEMIYDLATGDSAELAGETIRTLLAIVRNYPDSLEALIMKYSGLRLLLTKWTGQVTFGRELQDFVRLLDAKSGDRATMELKIRAATMIQSYWRSFKVRRELKKANKSLAKFQRKFRQRQQARKEQSETTRMRRELEYEVAIRRRKLLAEKREMEVKLMSTLPASTVRTHVQKQQEEAAIRIQARYKSWRERGKLEERKNMAKVVRATVTIQRAVRRWLRAIQYERMMEKLKRIAPISDETRTEIMDSIQRQQYISKPKERNREELTSQYRSSQAMMHEFIVNSLRAPKEDLEREALLSRLETDAQLLMSAPKLEEALESDVYKFTSNSTPAQIHAQSRHRLEMRRLQCTDTNWWRALQFEEDDEADDESKYLERRNDVMYIDGRIY